MIEKEPITVILSEKGWIRALKGHIDDTAKLEFKQGDGPKRAVKASTTDKLLLLATNGKVFTLAADQLPGTGCERAGAPITTSSGEVRPGANWVRTASFDLARAGAGGKRTGV